MGILTPLGGVDEFVNIQGKEVRNREAYDGCQKVWGIVADNGPNIQGSNFVHAATNCRRKSTMSWPYGAARCERHH